MTRAAATTRKPAAPKARSAQAHREASCDPAGVPPRALLDVLDRLGDAAALIDREAEAAVHGTSALTQLLAQVGAASTWPVPLGRWELAFPGLVQGLRETAAAFDDDRREPVHRWRVVGGDIAAEAVPIDARWIVLRLGDEARRQRDQRQALQRQLHDRESLLFTSRSLSVGEVGSVLAHELRQPIGAVGNVLRGLRLRVNRRVADDTSAAEELAAIERAIDQVSFASQVITRIREFTHARVPRFERLELGGLLRTSASLLDWDWQRLGVRFALDVPVDALHVRGDATMLQQVVANLMRNALDAMRAHPPASPRLALTLRREQDEAVVGIADNGAGMSAEAEQRLFVPFASSKPTGVGIGLSICRSFVELHQGKLWFARNDDGGCTFYFRLPLEHAAAHASAGAPSDTDADTGHDAAADNTTDTRRSM